MPNESSSSHLILTSLRYRGVNESLVLQSLRFLIKMNWLAGDEEPFNQVRKLLEEQNLNVDDLVDMMRKVTPSCGDVIIDCLWKSDVVPCERLFVFRLTDDGICCSFNVDENDRYIFGRKKLVSVRIASLTSIVWTLAYKIGPTLHWTTPSTSTASTQLYV